MAEVIDVSAREFEDDLGIWGCTRTLRRIRLVFWLGDYKLGAALAGEPAEAYGHMTHCDFEDLGYDHVRVQLSGVTIINPGKKGPNDYWEIEGDDAWMSLAYHEYFNGDGPRGEHGEHNDTPYATAQCAVHVNRRVIIRDDGTRVIIRGPEWALVGTVAVNIY